MHYILELIETNYIMKTYEVTFDETIPYTTPMFETACEKEMGESIFVEGDHEDVDWGDQELMPPVALAEPASITLLDQSSTSSTSLVLFEPLLLLVQAGPRVEQVPIEEVTSERQAPWDIQVVHPPQHMSDELQSKSQDPGHTKYMFILNWLIFKIHVYIFFFFSIFGTTDPGQINVPVPLLFATKVGQLTMH